MSQLHDFPFVLFYNDFPHKVPPLETLDDASGKYKFMVIELQKSDGEKKTVFRAARQIFDQTRHRHLMAVLESQVANKNITVLPLGGGVIEVVPEKKEVLIYDQRSEDYGAAETSLVSEMIQKAFPGFAVVDLADY